jgi:hypothetical protein
MPHEGDAGLGEIPTPVDELEPFFRRQLAEYQPRDNGEEYEYR